MIVSKICQYRSPLLLWFQTVPIITIVAGYRQQLASFGYRPGCSQIGQCGSGSPTESHSNSIQIYRAWSNRSVSEQRRNFHDIHPARKSLAPLFPYTCRRYTSKGQQTRQKSWTGSGQRRRGHLPVPDIWWGTPDRRINFTWQSKQSQIYPVNFLSLKSGVYSLVYNLELPLLKPTINSLLLGP